MTVYYPINDYQNRYDPAKNYEKHLVRAGNGVQAAEINEIQESLMQRQKRVDDVLIKDGSPTKDCGCIVDPETGAVQLEAGEIYLRGDVRKIAAAAFTIPIDTLVTIGVRLTEAVITELEDPALVGPADNTRNEGEPGAGRLQVNIAWGWEGDGSDAAFFPVYQVLNGYLLSKEPPPALDGVNRAIAIYDVDSAGGNYIIKGLAVQASYDRVTGKITVLVGEGRARVNGFGTELPRGMRLIWDAEMDIRAIVAEPKVYTPTVGSMRVNLDNTPLLTINQVRYVKQVEEAVQRGVAAGGRDSLQNNSILTLVAVNQGGTWNGTAYTGGTNYAVGTEVKITSGELDWSGAGAEPAPGSSYKCVYQYQTTQGATITAQDDTGFTITGPVAASQFQVDYTFALPRIDAIVIDQEGKVARIKGVATQYNPTAPNVPDTLLRIAGLSNTWGTNPVVESDATVMMPMKKMRGLEQLVFDLFDLVALERLKNDVGLRDPAAKRGVFVDAFSNDNLRDAGVAQTLAVLSGELQQAIAATVTQVGASISAPQMLPYDVVTLIEQPYRTGSMLVNPYQAFDPIPPTMRLDPAVDFWTEVVTAWGSDITKRLTRGAGSLVSITTSTGVELESSTTAAAEFLRQRSVGYTITGMGAGEQITGMTFDGIAVTPSATTANGSGTLTGTFTIPANIPAGTKDVRATTAGGLATTAAFTGRGEITTEERRNVTTVTATYFDPLAQTFTLQESRHVPGVDLWFANRGDRDIIVQIRNTEVGMPGRRIVAEKRIKPADVQASGTATRITFDAPVWLDASTEYAIVVLTDSATTALHIAELTKFDSNAQRHITSQPYQIGVLLSSSNASTWTAHNDKDMTFRLLGCSFTAATRTIALGTAAVTNASDFLAELNVDIPATGVAAELRATVPDGTVYRMTPDSPIALPVRVNGNVTLSLVLTGTAKISPVLYPGVQFIAGNIEASGQYVSRAFTSGNAARISVTFESMTPGTSMVVCEIQKQDGSWQALTLTSGTNVGDGWQERNYTLTGFTATTTRVRLTLAGTTAARPKVRKLRAVATD